MGEGLLGWRGLAGGGLGAVDGDVRSGEGLRSGVGLRESSGVGVGVDPGKCAEMRLRRIALAQ